MPIVSSVKFLAMKVMNLIGRTHKIVNSGYHPPEFFKEMWETIQSGETWRGEVKNRKKDGIYYWADSTIIPVLNEDGVPFQYMAIRYNITNQKENEAQILHLDNRDSLTGVANRRLFDCTISLINIIN